jgi:hypothetical protein
LVDGLSSTLAVCGSFLTSFANAGTCKLSKLAEGYFEARIQDLRAAAAEIAWWVVLEVFDRSLAGQILMKGCLAKSAKQRTPMFPRYINHGVPYRRAGS